MSETKDAVVETEETTKKKKKRKSIVSEENQQKIKKNWKTMLDNIKIMLYNQFCC